jgi:hypothetical protein
MTITNITYLDQFYPNNLAIFNNPSITRLYFNDYIEITQFLGSLEQDKIYVLTFDFVVSWLMFEEDFPVLNLSKPILVTRNSNPRLITNFIKSQIDLACLSYNIEQIDNLNDKTETAGVLIKYREINIF